MNRIIEVKECGPKCPYYKVMYMSKRGICNHPDAKLNGMHTFIDLLEGFEEGEPEFPKLCKLKEKKED
jgi:hypothetical protein